MNLIDKIRKDQLECRKKKDAIAASLLTTLIGEAAMVGKNKGNREPTDAEVIEVACKFLKNNKENQSIALDRQDNLWADLLSIEERHLNEYLPKQLSEKDISIALVGKFQKHSPTKGEMMKFLKENYAGQYDGKMAVKVVDDLLNNFKP